MSKRKGGKPDGELAAYFKYAVRSHGAVVIARFHQYDQAMEFAALLAVRFASANSLERSNQSSVEWQGDDGTRYRQNVAVTITDPEVIA